LILAVLVILLSGCAATDSALPVNTLRQIPREERVPLMVLNFKNSSLKNSANEYQPWEFGIPSMIMTDLESIGLFNILSWERLKDISAQLKFQYQGMVDEDQAVEVGRLAAARFLLTGNFMIIRQTLRIEVKVFSVESGIQIGASAVTGKIDQFFELEKKLVIGMTAYLGTVLTVDEKSRLLQNVETTSIDASLNNYAGEVALRKADQLKVQGRKDLAKELIQQAQAKFEKALEHDPNYQRAKKNLAGLAMAVPMTL
jgi:TolB-like protein